MQSFRKKIISLKKSGIDPLVEGVSNFKIENKEAEALAKKRSLDCLNCISNVEEPIDFLRVEDKRIKELSNRMCNDCGCTLSYKLRQSIKKCAKWLE
jgi:hypothetical protein